MSDKAPREVPPAMRPLVDKYWGRALEKANAATIDPAKAEETARAFLAMTFFLFAGLGGAMNLVRQRRNREADELLQAMLVSAGLAEGMTVHELAELLPGFAPPRPDPDRGA